MRSSARRLVLILSLGAGLLPAAASAQGAAGSPPPPGGGAVPPPGGGAAAADPKDSKEAKDPPKGEIGGYAYSDKAPRAAAPHSVRRTTGPLASFPGFEQLSDGGSRFFVQLSQAVGVEERRAPGSVSYVLKGARLRVHNDANALVTVHFNTPVYRAKLVPSGNDLVFVLELRSAATPTFKVTANQDKTSTLRIDFAKGDFATGDQGFVPPAEPVVTGKAPRRGKGAGRAPSAPPPSGDASNPGPTP